jgi:hypothetical protein
MFTAQQMVRRRKPAPQAKPEPENQEEATPEEKVMAAAAGTTK